VSRLPDPGSRAARVVLISVAGLQPEHYGVVAGATEPGLAAKSAPMPNLAALGNAGVYAEAVEAVLPSSPYPVHASLVTGMWPPRHGVLGDELLGPTGLHVRGLARESRILGLPLWRAARSEGRAVAALGWPSTRGADVDLLLPDLGLPDRDEKALWLQSLSREATPWVVDRLQQLDETLADMAWPTVARQDMLIEGLACEIARQPVTPALWLLAFGHSGMVLGQVGPADDRARAALSRVDASIGRIVDCFREAGLLADSVFIVVGDRSFLPVHTLVSPNIVLEQVGLITLAPVLQGSGVARWQAFVRSSGGSGLVYADSEADALLARAALEEEIGRSRGFRIVPATELQRLHADPQVWFGLEGLPGYGLGKGVKGKLLVPTERRGLSGYLPNRAGSEVGLVAWGAGVRSGAHVSRMSQVDVAPTVARLLRFELPAAEGSAQLGILAP